MKFCMNTNNEKAREFCDNIMKLMSYDLIFDVGWCSLAFSKGVGTITKPQLIGFMS